MEIINPSAGNPMGEKKNKTPNKIEVNWLIHTLTKEERGRGKAQERYR